MAVLPPHVWEVHVGIYFVSWPEVEQVLDPWTWSPPSGCGPAVGSAPGASCFLLVTLAKYCPGRCCWNDNRHLREMGEMDHVGAYNPRDHSCVAGWLGNGNHTYIPHTASGSPCKLHRSGDGSCDTETVFAQVSHPQYSVSLSSTGHVVQSQMARSHWSDLARGDMFAGLGGMVY